MKSAVRTGLQYGLWPALLTACMAVTIVGMAHDWGYLAFNLAYLSLAATLFLLERAMPFEKSWLKSDGQILVDLTHTLVNKGAAQIMIMMGAVFGFAEMVGETGGGIWPSHWPLLAQVALGLVCIEAGLYTAHRVAHEVPRIWRFHAVHHSSTRLSFINTGRFHLVDTALSIALSQPILFLLGAPLEVFKLTSAATAFIGMLTHCNVDLRFGWLAYVFNTPTLHRFHHSMDLSEGNKNYGENLVLFDLLLGTYFNPKRRPTTTIGVPEPMPKDYLGQLMHPFRAEQPAEPARPAEQTS